MPASAPAALARLLDRATCDTGGITCRPSRAQGWRGGCAPKQRHASGRAAASGVGNSGRWHEGYRLGFEAARAEAAAFAERAGQGALAAAIRAMAPLPERGAAQ
jgi:hypothetical protein